MWRSIKSQGWNDGKRLTPATASCGWRTRLMDSSTWRVGMEVLLHSLVERGIERAVRLRDVVLLASLFTLVGLESSCSRSSSPSAPDPPGGPYIGTWAGPITSAVIGRGNATVVFDSG